MIKKPIYIPDALFSWNKYYESLTPIRNLREVMPFGYESDKSLFGINLLDGYICVSGSSSSAWNKKKAIPCYINLVNKLKEVLPYKICIVQACEGDDFLRVVSDETDTPFVPIYIPIISMMNLLSHAKVYISGRYHPSILASLGGTPCVFLGANSHKNMGLQEMLEYEDGIEFNPYPEQDEITNICKLAKNKIQRGNSLRNKIIDVVNHRATVAKEVLRYME